MKTLTEFDGFRLKAALATKAEVLRGRKGKAVQPKKAPETMTESAPEAEAAAPAEAAPDAEQPAAEAVEAATTEATEAPAADAPAAEEQAADAPAADAPAEAAPADSSPADTSKDELTAALGEALKLEGDKLTLMLAALEVAEARRDNLKRVVVFTVAEGQKAPSGAVQKGDKWYLAEYFFQPSSQPRQGRGGPGGDKKGGRGKGRGGRGGRDDKRGGRGGGGGGAGRGDGRRPAEQTLGAAGPNPAGGGGARPDRPKREDRPRREPRPPRAPAEAGPAKPPSVKPLVTPLVTPVKPQGEPSGTGQTS